DRRHLELVLGRHLGRYRDRTLASYWAFCRHPRSSLRATIVSRVTEAAGRKFSLAARDRIVVDDPPPANWSTLSYGFCVFARREDCNAEEELQAGRDRHQTAPG